MYEVTRSSQRGLVQTEFRLKKKHRDQDRAIKTAYGRYIDRDDRRDDMTSRGKLAGSKKRVKSEQSRVPNDPLERADRQAAQGPAGPAGSTPPPKRGAVIPPELTATQDELDWILDGLPSAAALSDLLGFLFSNAGR